MGNTLTLIKDFFFQKSLAPRLEMLHKYSVYGKNITVQYRKVTLIVSQIRHLPMLFLAPDPENRVWVYSIPHLILPKDGG